MKYKNKGKKVMKFIFIINRQAGREKYKQVLPNIEKVCNKRNLEYEIRFIEENLNAAEIANEYKDGENVIYIVGGDGTLTKTLPGIIGTNNKIGIIPSGSGNDTYKTIKKLPNGETKIDLGRINDVYFINTACTGLDAEVANNLDILKETKIPTNQLYNASIIYTFAKYKFRKIKFITKIKTFEAKYSMLSICNGGFYGGGFNVAPKALLTDGLFDIYYAEKINKLRMIPLLLKMKNGKHEGKRYIHKFRTNHVELELEEKITFNIDGEKLEGKRFVIDLIPEAITIYNNNELVEEILNEK